MFCHCFRRNSQSNVSDESVNKAKAASARGRSWPDEDPTAKAVTARSDEIVVTGTGFKETLVLWGRGDFDGDGRQDLLVETRDTLTEGTYRNLRLFVLSRETPTARLSSFGSFNKPILSDYPRSFIGPPHRYAA